MPTFVPGQRWISETEPELGLGMVLAAEGHRLTLLYIASSERRTYAMHNAPLTRVRFGPGESAESNEGWKLAITEVEERGGLLIYRGIDDQGRPAELEEMDLNHFLQFHKPQDRLFTGQLDPSALFRLRHETLHWVAELEQSPVRGLCGGRTSLIAHQIFIAHEVARREFPRVLLADEVGLGKTIEAGLIIHHQLLTGRAQRVLVIVPEPLLYQWLVEMRRRFNLRFSLFDQTRPGDGEEGNPFLSEQWVLCSLELLMRQPELQDHAVAGEWDLCVVDEAHHLTWSESAASPEYLFVARLGQEVPGLLLLTATPEQLGKQSHFARLRLLDPDRFHGYEPFIAEEREYERLAEVIRHLLDDPELDRDTLAQLKAWVAADLADELLARLDDPASAPAAREELIRLLLDRHGTGRVLFRNTRATIKGFPERQLHAAMLPLPEEYRQLLARPDAGIEHLAHPESLLAEVGPPGTDWWRLDPRVPWLLETLRGLRPAKALVICAAARTAIDLEEALRLGGFRAAVFHEGLPIVARDRAAAWFADVEDGAQVLVCSEIGSEGRNFQFAHHLILFDLPLHPDLLEQRIGRLDRIGQTETIHIHTAGFSGSGQEVLFRWYHEGLDAFHRPNPAAVAVHGKLVSRLEQTLRCAEEPAIRELVDAARTLAVAIEAELHDGRDRLLELNSCRKEEAERLLTAASAQDRDQRLWTYLEQIFDAYGVNVEEHSRDCYILRPGEHMRTQFPELPDEGVTVTLDRAIGLAREDMLFLTFEHPMVRGAMDLVLNGEYGNAALSVVRHPDLEPGQILLEAFFVADCIAPRRLHLARFFPPTLLRFLLAEDGTDVSALPSAELVEQPRQFDREHALELIRSQRQLIQRLLDKAEASAKGRLPALVAACSQRMIDTMTAELKRLAALRRVNPNVRQEELDQLKENTLTMHACIQSASLRLDALRVLVAI